MREMGVDEEMSVLEKIFGARNGVESCTERNIIG
jgi:hypothetical protein